MKIVCIGSGNVATHMAGAFKAKGHDLIQVWSRNIDHAGKLAGAVGGKAISDLTMLDLHADLYIIAVKDDAIATIAQALADVKGFVVHTSGATAMDELSSFNAYGVLYPLQTFSLSKDIEFAGVPLCIEGKDPESLRMVRSIAAELSALIYEVDSEHRKILHLAGVFACNFVNHLYNLGGQILSAHKLDFEILRPLIMETALKVQTGEPINVQTGPAIRGDEQTMLKHLELLNDTPHLQDIYQTLSKSIKKSN